MERVILLAAAAIGLLLLLRLMTAPIRLVWKLALNLVCGFAVLILLNLFGGLIGVTFGLNLFSAAAAGLLGIPGIGLLLIFKAIL